MSHVVNFTDRLNPFTASWTKKGNNLCLGQWEIRYLGRLLTVDAGRREKDLGTFGIFSYIYPDDEDFAEGLLEDDWILEHADWLANFFSEHDIPVDEAHMRWLYQAANPHDWRCGSCGGCL